jgi:hypothetical protein
MPKHFSTIQKCAFGFAALFLGVYLLDYVPGSMDQSGLMFGLFRMTRIVDIGHLALGGLSLIAALSSARIARIYFWVLGVWYTIDVVTFFFGHFHSLSLLVNVLTNLPHLLVFPAAYWIALNVGKPKAAAGAA